MKELVIDSFAGGGGASEGIKQALGRDPDIAINHDPMALAMHRINHPGTRHMVEDVVSVDAVGMCAGQPIGMLWMSPDCTDHSKAKGAAPRRADKNTRGLAWAIVGWVKALPEWQRPRVIFLENVEEFQDWGPLLPNGRRCPARKGQIFQQFVEAWRGLGYDQIDWQERRAWKTGAKTIRKRLYMIIRRDGEPIVWSEAEFGNPNDPVDAERIARGELKVWRTAADFIDWSLPCPSIFDTAEEIKRKYGIRAIRPLADNTMARIAKGVMRYVVNNPRPFLVKVNHTGRVVEARDREIDQPTGTMTAKRDDAVVVPSLAPFVTYAQQGGGSRSAETPLHTVTASAKDQNAVVMPFVTKFNSGSVGSAIDEPLHTVTAHSSETHGGGAAPLGVVTPFLMPRYQEKEGHQPRTRSVTEPSATIIAGDNVPGHLVAPYLVPRYGERPGQEPRTRSVDQPAPVIVPTGNEGSLAAVYMSRQFGASVGSEADAPVGTITAGGAGKAAVVAAFLAQHNGGPRPGAPAHPADEPISTIATAGSQQNVVTAHMLNLRGSDRRDAPADQPVRTVSAEGNHAATVYAFLAKYFGEGLPSQPADEPLHTVTAKPRHGLVTVTVEGEPYVIVDIGMRMLTPRERFDAQGFPRDYVIDRGILEDGTTVRFTLEQQGRMCGNSVCPDEARALVAANYRPRDVVAPSKKKPSAMPLLVAAE